MLVFLIEPKRYLNSPIARAELAHLVGRRRNLRAWMRLPSYTILLIAALIASIPLWIFVDSEHVGQLQVMVIAIGGLHVLVSVRTLIVATQAISRETRDHSWEVLVLTGMDARHIILSKWCAILRYVWRLHVFVALLKLGVGLALAHYLHNIPLQDCFSGGDMFCYGQFPVSHILHPSLAKVLLAGGLLILLSLLEAAVLAALGLLAALLVKDQSVFKLMLAITLRALLVLVGLLGLVASDQNTEILTRYPETTGCIHPNIGGICQEWRVLLETAELGIITLADGGTLASANIMRPTGATLFTLRNIMSGLLGIGLYVVVLCAILWLAQALAHRENALPPDPIDLQTLRR